MHYDDVVEEQVDLVVNSFERTYRRVLEPGFFPRIEEQNRRRFARRVALINNVEDLADARRRAEDLVRRGEIDLYLVVAEWIGAALTKTGLTWADLGRIPHYSDCALVAVCLDGPSWIVYWDAEVSLRRPVDWVGPSLDLLRPDSRVLVANPTSGLGELAWLAEELSGDFAFSYGCSDQLFLAEKARLARPIYRERCAVSLRFPLAHVAPVWEQRLDAYMRSNRLLRANHLGSIYEHPAEGGTYPAAHRRERMRKLRNYLLVRSFAYLRLRHPCRSTWGHRALRHHPRIMAALEDGPAAPVGSGG